MAFGIFARQISASADIPMVISGIVVIVVILLLVWLLFDDKR